MDGEKRRGVKSTTAVGRLSVAFVVISILLTGFHFHSCPLSGIAFFAGSILGAVSLVLGVPSKSSRVIVAGALAIMAHILMTH